MEYLGPQICHERVSPLFHRLKCYHFCRRYNQRPFWLIDR
ncbi:putative flagellar basal-body M-ring protein [Listeria monocytogenes]|nr:putative flagellar basal-body M-ring protein [Listeria monocytogenes]